MDKQKLSILGFIPARAQSKGIPAKHLRKLRGKPIIEYTIEAACASRYLDRIIVSTDSEEIAAIARKAGAEVPFLRPGNIAGDKSPMADAVSHLIEYLADNEGYSPDIFVALYPTSPFRRAGLIDQVLESFLADKDASEPGEIEVVQLLVCGRVLKGLHYYHQSNTDTRLISYSLPLSDRTIQNGSGLYRISGSIGAHVYSLDVWSRCFKTTVKYKSPLESPTGNDYWENAETGKQMRRDLFILDDIEAIELDEPIDFFRALAVSRNSGDDR